VGRPILEFERVTRHYRAESLTPPALAEVTLTIAPGAFVTVTGASGSGKSTLLNLAGGLDQPDGGSVRLDGRDFGSLCDSERSACRLQRIGFIFQHFNLLPRMSALDNVALPLVYAGISRKARLARAAVGLERVGLGHRGACRPAELSGGEQQRVAIARALVNGPDLLLADEPTGALDSATGASILRTLAELNAQGVTIVLVTHDRDVAAVGSRCLRFHDGRLVGDTEWDRRAALERGARA
jgi:putative ABC transport system ATP-binding protein